MIDVMSIISAQVDEIKKIARILDDGCLSVEYMRNILIHAADTIESLSIKLSAANMERSERYYGGGWIVASERMPNEEQCIDAETGYYGRSDYVLCSAYDEYEMRDVMWIDYTIDGEWQTHEYDEEEKLAWQPLPSPYNPDEE